MLRVEPIIDLFDAKTRADIIETMTSTEVLPFDTGSVSWNQGNAELSISYAHRPDSRLLLGIRALDFDHSHNLRSRSVMRSVRDDGANVAFETWDDSISFFGSYAWLRLVDSEKDIQYGHFDTSQSSPWQTPPKEISRQIYFSKPYDTPPKVNVWINGLDTSNGANVRFYVSAESISERGFTLHTRTWDDSTVYWASLCWLAHDSARDDIASGWVSTRQKPGLPNMQNTGDVHFGDAKFVKTPQVFMALAGLDMDKNHNQRLLIDPTHITKTGMSYSLNTWSDTGLYCIDAVWIAF